MPVQYEGTLAEHRAVRSTVGIFDVSHLGRFLLTGSGGLDLISRLLCNDPVKIGPGRAQYTMMLTADGGVVDDLIYWWLDDERFVVLPNGANHAEVVSAFDEASSDDSMVTDDRTESVLLAVQGPEAPEIVEAVLGAMPRPFRVIEGLGPSGSITAAGTGYTGERGAEIMVPAAEGEAIFEAFMQAGAVPCGLGARDTLRLEMGYPLWGQDLDRTTSPLEADLGWVVGWDHDFVGKEALQRMRDDGLARRLIGFRFDDRIIPRHGYAVRADGSTGSVTSGNFSPMLGVGIGLAYLAPPPKTETVEVEVRGSWHEAQITSPPFLER